MKILDEMKQVIVIRTDVTMTSGKRCSQAAHASLTAYMNYIKIFPEMENLWFKESQTKITCKSKLLEELLDIYNKAKNENIPCSLIEDEGRTCFNTDSSTIFNYFGR